MNEKEFKKFQKIEVEINRYEECKRLKRILETKISIKNALAHSIRTTMVVFNDPDILSYFLLHLTEDTNENAVLSIGGNKYDKLLEVLRQVEGENELEPNIKLKERFLKSYAKFLDWEKQFNTVCLEITELSIKIDNI